MPWILGMARGSRPCKNADVAEHRNRQLHQQLAGQPYQLQSQMWQAAAAAAGTATAAALDSTGESAGRQQARELLSPASPSVASPVMLEPPSSWWNTDKQAAEAEATTASGSAQISAAGSEDGGAQAQQASPPSATGTASAAEAARRLSFAAQPCVPVVVKLHRVANRHGTLVANKWGVLDEVCACLDVTPPHAA